MNVNNLPKDMKQLEQWVLGDLKKAPINANNGLYAKSTDSTTWNSFDKCLDYYEKHKAELKEGIGFVLSDNDPYVCIDLDHCITDGRVNNNVLAILNNFKGCYKEISVSGNGIHIFCKGIKHIRDCKNEKIKTAEEPLVEIYSTNRYLIMTGNLFDKSDSSVNECQSGINFIENIYFNGRQKGHQEKKETTTTNGSTVYSSDGMTVTEIVDKLHQEHPEFLGKAKESGYVCPLCRNGEGEDGTGISQWNDGSNKIKYKCFKCEAIGDTVDWWSWYRKLGDVKSDNLVDVIKDYANMNNIKVKDVLDNVPFTIYEGSVEPDVEEFGTVAEPITPEIQTEISELSKEDLDFKEFCRSIGCMHYFYNDGHLESKGIKLCSIKQNGNEFKCLSKKAVNGKDRYYCFNNADSKYNTTIGSTFSFITKTDREEYTDSFVIFTDNFIDSLVLSNLGINVFQVANNNVVGIKHILTQNRQSWKYKSIIFTFCNSEQEKLFKKELADINLDINYNNFKGSSDVSISELCRNSYEEFVKIVGNVLSEINKKVKQNNQDTFGYWFVNRFNRDLKIQEKRIPTDIRCFDYIINKGLPVGLTVLGAETSLGKTTFLTQIAENLCHNGNIVLYFNLEQSQFEVFSKGLKRQCYRDNKPLLLQHSNENANNFYKYVNYSNYNVIECDFNTTITTIEDKINRVKRHLHTNEDGTKQQIIIFVDYLQALQLEQNGKIVTNMSDKQKTDKLIHDLKVLSKETETPIVAVSSLNRDSYKKGVDLKAFKESGSIEYTANILLGMSRALRGYTDEKGNTKWKEEPDVNGIRKVFVKQMKDRNGERDKNCLLHFNLEFQYFFDPEYSAEDYFKPLEIAEIEEEMEEEGITPDFV